MLDVRRLRVLVEVSRRSSFSAAAEALSFTQPSVSRQIAALEREAGTRLVERDARSVRLTQAGEIVVAHAEAILARLDAVDDHLRALADLEGGSLALAAFASANAWLVPEALRRFAERHPRVELSLAGVGSHGHLAALRAREIDLALLTDWDLPGRDDIDGVETALLLEDELYVALPRRHALAGRRRLTLRDLGRETWIEGAHPDCLGPLQQLSDAIGIQPRIGFHCDDWSGKQALVAAGVGIMLFPALALRNRRDDIVVRPLSGDVAARRVYVAHSDGYRAPAVEAMIAVLRETAKR